MILLYLFSKHQSGQHSPIPHLYFIDILIEQLKSIFLLLIYLRHHVFFLFLDFLVLFDFEDLAHLHFLLLELLEQLVHLFYLWMLGVESV